MNVLDCTSGRLCKKLCAPGLNRGLCAVRSAGSFCQGWLCLGGLVGFDDGGSDCNIIKGWLI